MNVTASFLSAAVAGLALTILPHASAQTGSVVTINADKVMVLNGRKVFPITLSPGPANNAKTPLGDDALEEFSDAGALFLRIVQTANWDAALIATQRAALDWAAAHGMYCMVNLRELSAFPAGAAATEAELRSVMGEFKNHPALGIWKNKDEAWWGDTSAEDLKRGYDVIKAEDANHPVEQTHAPRGTLADLQPYNVAADVFAIDIYPVGVPPGANSLLANKEISMVGDYTKFLRDVTNNEKQIWMVEQIAWSGVTPPGKTLVYPTPRQSRYMAWQAIANGARGLMFFGGNITATLNAQDTPLGWNWTFWNDVLKPVVREIGDHSAAAKALVAPDSALPITMSGTTAPDIEYVVREASPYLFIIACKRETTTKSITFSGLPAWATTGEVMFESPRTVTAAGGQFTDTFAPFDVHVYRFSQTPQAPTILFPPQSRGNHPGTKATFTATADGTGPFTWQWRKDGVALQDGGNVSGTKSPVLTLERVTAADAASYDVVVTGTGSVTSAAATLTILVYQPTQVPTIAAHPQNWTGSPGASANFSVAVSGNGPFAYQWRKNGEALSDGGNVSGANTWNLTLSNLSPFDAGNYDVVVSGFSSATSNPAALTTATPQGQVFLYEPFDYPVGTLLTANTPSNWVTNGAGGPDDMMVTAGSLSLNGLAGPTGHSATGGGAGPGVRRIFSPGVNSGAMYFSALFRLDQIGSWNGAASQVGALTMSDNVSFRCAVLARTAGTGYNLGVQKGGTGATTTFDTTEIPPGATVFLAGKYDFSVSPNVASLWINPAPAEFGGTAEPAAAPLSASSGTDPVGIVIDRFNMRQNTATSVPAVYVWDELRFGRTWSDVTPPPPPVISDITRPGNGAFQFRYFNTSSRSYSVHAAGNLTDWLPVGAGVLISPGLFEFTDADAANHARRFYQLRSP